MPGLPAGHTVLGSTRLQAHVGSLAVSSTPCLWSSAAQQSDKLPRLTQQQVLAAGQPSAHPFLVSPLLTQYPVMVTSR